METATTSTSTNTEPCQPATPQKEHLWLKKLVGSWTTEAECMGPDGQPMREKQRGSEIVKPLGDLWVVGEGEASAPDGSPFLMRVTLGYDPQRNCFVGTWVGSTMTTLWVYEGKLDRGEKILTLSADGPSFSDPNKTAKYQDIIELKGANERTWTSRFQEEGGPWTQMMKATYRRS